MRPTRLSFLFVGFLLCMATFSLRSAHSAEMPHKIRVAYTVIGGAAWPIWTAQEKGIFKKYGLEAELIYLASASLALQGLLAGDVDLLATATGPAVMIAQLGGADVVMVGATANTPNGTFMVKPDIKAPSDLKGQAIGVTRFGSSSDYAARFALRKWGLTPGRDVTILQMGGVPEIFSGMVSGRISGGMLYPPFDIRASKRGFKELADPGQLGLVFPQTPITVRRKYLDTNRDTLKRYLMIVSEAIHLIKTNKPVAEAVLGKYTKTSDQAVLTSAYDKDVPTIDRIPLVDLKGVEAVLEFIKEERVEAKKSKPEDFVDNSLVGELDDSGFYKRLWGGKGS